MSHIRADREAYRQFPGQEAAWRADPAGMMADTLLNGGLGERKRRGGLTAAAPLSFRQASAPMNLPFTL